ncbi:MAG: Crp/Fnr family transcriptional regulator [Acidimicrobiales bacterium]
MVDPNPAHQLLEGLSAPARDRFLAVSFRKSVNPGARLFLYGDAATDLFLIESGRLAVQREQRDGTVLTFTVLGPGAALGELGYLEGVPVRGASVLALERSRVLGIPYSTLDELRESDPSVDRLLIEVMKREVLRLSNHVVVTAYGSVDERVGFAIKVLLGPVEGPGPHPVQVTQEDLASVAGLTRSTANRSLRHLSEAGVIDVRRGRIRVLDLARLDALVEVG